MSTNQTNAHPYYRTLKGYALDPGFSTQLNTMRVNEVVYKILWESVEPGPIGQYIEVIDIDPPSDCYYEPVDLNAPAVLGQGGLPLSEGNPQFHQQMVYAVIMMTIHHFEHALGRKIIWRHRLHVRQSSDEGERGMEQHHSAEYVSKLRIYPHAFRSPNAYYDQEKVALLFGYFNASNQTLGSNFPGGVVFTSLSPDIVAHEATHAILDSIHYRFIEDTNPDVGAFHEAFSDIVALLQRFTFRELVEHQLATTQGRLDRYSVLGELATQFGQALENERGALRSAIGRMDENDKWQKHKPDPRAYQTVTEPHDRGAILVAAIFEAFQRIYDYKTQDLIRIATGGSGVLPTGNINPDLVKRLASEACQIASHLLHVCIRALDYCPPLDITYGDYLRALITADLDFAPEDENGYRIALIEAFRAWGIFPDRVNTMSVESLRWLRPNFTRAERNMFYHVAKFLGQEMTSLIEVDDKERRDHQNEGDDRKAFYLKTRKLQAAFHAYLTKRKMPLFNSKDGESLLNKLGLTGHPVKLKYEGKTITFPAPALEVHKISPAFRTGREGRHIQQVIITLSQTLRKEVPVNLPNSKRMGSRVLMFRGGCTLILTLGNLREVQYVIVKNVKSQRRFGAQVEFQDADGDSGLNLNTYRPEQSGNHDLNFKNLHFNSR